MTSEQVAALVGIVIDLAGIAALVIGRVREDFAHVPFFVAFAREKNFDDGCCNGATTCRPHFGELGQPD